MVNKNRIINEFIKLNSFDSESFKELDISLYLFDKLKSLGLEVEIDNAGHILNENPKATGNIYGFLKGTKPGDSILLSSHMDTVSPSIGKKVVIDGNIVKSAGNTVLGADDLTGIVSILEALTLIKENKIPHPDIEVVFFIAEEPYCRGSSQFDFSKIKSKIAYVFDLDGPVGGAAISAPSIIQFEAKVNGKSAHAGFEPEKGVSAIVALSKGISKLRLGRLDKDSTANVGTINGGTGKNVVPGEARITGEVRSMSSSKALEIIDEIRNILDSEAKVSGASIEFKYEEMIKAYKIYDDEEVIKRYRKALEELNINPIFKETFGGSDNNSFNKHGIKGIVVANAMNLVHTTSEYFEIDEFVRSASIAYKLLTI